MPTAFEVCPSPFYLSQGSTDSIQLFSGNPTPGGNVAFTEINDPQPVMKDYNAVAFREADRFMYALRSSTSSEIPGGGSAQLIRVGANAEIENLGEIAGLTDSFYLAGDMNPAGDYYVLSGTARTVLVNIDLGAGPVSGGAASFTTVNMNDGSGIPMELNSGDIAWADGKLWGLHETAGGVWYLASVDTTTGEISLAPNPTGADHPFGALWGSPDGIYGNANDGSGFFYFDLDSGVATKIADSAGASRNDAARCVSNRPLFDADIQITKTNNQAVYTPGQLVTYDIVVSNAGPFGATAVNVSDPLPADVSAATWTCGDETGGAICREASGSGDINGVVDLPNGASATYRLSFTLDAGFSGNLVNTVSAEAPQIPGGPKQARDTDGSNDSATDTDTPAPVPGSGDDSPAAVPAQPYGLLVVQLLALFVFAIRRRSTIRT